jgi:integrase/recombinase XerD
MPYKLTTIINKISTISNLDNRGILYEFSDYMSKKELLPNHQINNLKVAITLTRYLQSETFLCVNNSQQIIDFLDSKKKGLEEDPDRRWITTWNYYLHRTKLFYRWLHNRHKIEGLIEPNDSDLKTPLFMQIKPKKTKRVSPYAETELWDRDDILLVTKYESYKRNKAILKDSSGAHIPFRVTFDDDIIFTDQNDLTFLHIRRPYLKVGHVEFDEIP